MPQVTIKKQMKYLFVWLWILSIVPAIAAQQTTVIYLAGDSTMAAKAGNKRPETGWGEAFGKHFVADSVRLENHARNGSSTRTFINENRWQTIIDKLHHGDYVFIQFGHNDSSPHKVDRYTTPEAYRANLHRLVREVKSKQGVPVLLTPVVRRRFDAAHRFYDSHGVYPQIVREVAGEMNVNLIDAHRLSKRLVVDYGAEESKKLFLHLAPGESLNYPQGLKDDTHFSPHGANQIAALIAADLKRQQLPLAKHLSPNAAAHTQLVIAVTANPKPERDTEIISLEWQSLIRRLPKLNSIENIAVVDADTDDAQAGLKVDVDGDGTPDKLVFEARFTVREPFFARQPTKIFFIKTNDDDTSALNKSLNAATIKQVVQQPVEPHTVTFLTPLGERLSQAKKPISNLLAEGLIAAYPNPAKFGSNPRWHYDNAYFLIGLYDLGVRDGNRKYKDYVKRWVDVYVRGDGSIDARTLKTGDYELDSMLPGRLLIRLYRDTRDERYRHAAHQVIKQLETQPRTADGGYWHKKSYPQQMWLDGLYMAGPLSVEFAKTFNKPELYDEAAKQTLMMYDRTRTADGSLLYHGWEATKTVRWANARTGTSPEVWSRAVGWYVAGLVDELEHLPTNHPARAAIIKILQTVAAGIVTHQDAETGLWYQVLDKGNRRDNWHETSASAMFVYALAKGVKQKHLADKYLTAARRAYDNLIKRHLYVDAQGQVYLTGTVYVGTLNPKVSDGSYRSYISTARQVNDIKGLGAMLAACIEIEK